MEVAIAIAIAVAVAIAALSGLEALAWVRRRRRIKRLATVVDGMKLEIGRELAPELERLAADLTEWIRENEP